MGKSRKNKKRGRTQLLYEAARKARTDDPDIAPPLAETNGKGTPSQTSITSDTDGEEDVSEEELNQVVRTLSLLTKTPQKLELVRYSKRFKDLRRVLHPLVLQQIKAYDKGTDYRTKVSVHLAKKEYVPAISALQACQEFEQIPKQGTIQRWVREVDSCEEGQQKIELLSLILTLGGAEQEGEDAASNADSDGLNKHDPRVAIIQAQEHVSTTINPTDDNGSITILDSWAIPDSAHDIVHKDAEHDHQKLAFSSKIIYQEKADERTPPNHFDLLLHYAIPTHPNDRIIPFHNTQDGIVDCYEVPFLSGAMVLQNVLSPRECLYLREAATSLGYRPDHPTSLEQSTGIDSCEWLIHDTIHAAIFERVKALLPKDSNDLRSSNSSEKSNLKSNLNSSKTTFILHSINRRWRFFRYGEGCIYRPHIDGSWPEGRLSADGEHYETDTSGRTKSFLTFLIYLNDDFEGGATRFYHAAKAKGRGMVARGVQPKMGCVLVFPQGNTASLLHEGSPVSKGTKYVIRTDVLYSRDDNESCCTHQSSDTASNQSLHPRFPSPSIQNEQASPMA